jgi:hypothetical protein
MIEVHCAVLSGLRDGLLPAWPVTVALARCCVVFVSGGGGGGGAGCCGALP